MLTPNCRNIQWQKSCISCEMVCLGKKLQLWHFRIVIFKVFISQIEQFAPLKRVEKVSFPFGLQSVPPRTINMDTNPIPRETPFPKSIIFRVYLKFPPQQKQRQISPFQTQPHTSVFNASSVQTVTGCAKNKGLIGFSAAWRIFWVGKVLFCGVRKLKVKFPCQDWCWWGYRLLSGTCHCW